MMDNEKSEEEDTEDDFCLNFLLVSYFLNDLNFTIKLKFFVLFYLTIFYFYLSTVNHFLWTKCYSDEIIIKETL